MALESWAEATILAVTLPWMRAGMGSPDAAGSALDSEKKGGDSGSALPTPTSQRWGSWASRTRWDGEAWSRVRLPPPKARRYGVGLADRRALKPVFVRMALIKELREWVYPLTLGNESAKRGEQSSRRNGDGGEAQNARL